MSKRLSIGDYHVGPYCGSRWLYPTKSDLKYYGLFRRVDRGFSIMQILFWKEKINA